MCIRSRKDLRCAEQGVSLIELLVFIVVIGIALAGIIMAMNLNTEQSVDPLLRKQALAVAEAWLEEVESLPFASIDSFSSNPTSTHMPDGYSAKVDVAQDTSIVDASPLAGSNVRRIKVTVRYNAGRDEISLEGYRTNY